MLEQPLDIRGIAMRFLEPEREYRWVAPFRWRGSVDLMACNLDLKKRQRLKQIISLDGSDRGPRLARAACVAARQGRVTLAQKLFEAHVLDCTVPIEIEVRARNVLNDERKRVRTLLNRLREWPAGIWNLQDVPAWIIPAFIYRFRTMVHNNPITILSGGHLLCPGEWEWSIPESSPHPSEVIRRDGMINPLELL